MAQKREQQQPKAAMIPPLEIGSFVALGSGRSEFIGSASGVFFADTVFRAFLSLSPPSDLKNGHEMHSESNRDPESTHDCFEGAENPPRQVSCNPSPEAVPVGPQLSKDTQPCGLSTLGAVPPPAVTKQLIMTYFQYWHPIFPFLQGKAFLEDVNIAYSERLDTDSNDCSSRYSYETLCRTINVQCILNIAATAPGVDLEPSHRIQSTQGLMQLLGPVYSSPDITSLQALLAAELYLITIMSLRAASTVHGVLTRIIYNMGLHRCPFRYIQLPEEKRAIRKRIFWCAYVFDRHIGQALGHPLSFHDSDIDVCIPGMEELHRPVAATNSNSISQEGPSQDVLAHLPIHQQHNSHISETEAEGLGHASPAISNAAGQQMNIGGGQVEAILGYVAMHSKLLGEILDLFHRSIHDRMVIQEAVQEITYRIHAWWNGLPLTFQNSPVGERGSSISPHHILFITLYNHTLLLVNRPFLSLPRQRIVFKSSLQLAINASHSLLSHLKENMNDVFVMSWPCTLSAVWTAGLVISFSALLGQYPFLKTQTDISHCLTILKAMGNKWTSARQCHTALDALFGKLCARDAGRENDPAPEDPLGQGRRGYDIMLQGTDHIQMIQAPDSDQRSAKRPRYRDTNIGPNDVSLDMQTEWDSLNESYLRIPQNWISLPQYIGPDFGFDMSESNGFFGGEDITNFVPNTDLGSLFQNIP